MSAKRCCDLLLEHSDVSGFDLILSLQILIESEFWSVN
jgi:hypothetical protein